LRYLTFGPERPTYKIAILVNEIKRDEILRAYVTPYGLREDDIIVITLHQSPGKKSTPAAERKQYILDELKPTLEGLGVQYLIVADGDYFKTFTKVQKIDPVLGYVFATEFGDWHLVYVPAYLSIYYDPVKVPQKINTSINALIRWMLGTYTDPGIDIIKFCEYPQTIQEISLWLERLLDMDKDLAIDTETFSLKHYSAGIGTISFSWSKSEGICFPVDILDDPAYSAACRTLLRSFFERFKRKAIYHNISFDVYVLIYQLFMKDLLDNEGLLHGLEVMLRNWDDTKLITYLATNSCAGKNELKLKIQAQEYAGDYAQEDIKDIRKIPLPQLLQYNLVDGLSTWFVHEKHYQRMVKDNQLEIYETIFKPAIVDIIQMQLTGMPVNMERVLQVEEILLTLSEDARARMLQLPMIQQFEYQRLEAYTAKMNAEWVKKRMTVAEMGELAKTHEPTRKEVTFNPNSGPQLQKLLYEDLGLPVIDRTDTKQPATGGKTLEKLINHAQSQEVKDFLTALMEYSAVATILETFIPALKGAQLGPDGWHWLFGNFNLGGTVSGRLSSSDPNLQNIPANVEMKIMQALLDRFPLLQRYAKKGKLSLGKLIKYCFQAPPGWFFCGIDFASLEDRISALTTKDPNKLKVYTDGYDGHSLRAHSYFADQMPAFLNLDMTVELINSIQEKYPALRQDSKVPTFLLTYGGTYMGIMNALGWPEAKAKAVEKSYHELYVVSDNWIQAKLAQACKDGYVTVAFGLRVRTPLLHRTVLGTTKTPYQAEAEGRTAGNALGQSWCLLNSRAGSEFYGKVRKSEFRHDIRPCAQIHDANYCLVRDNVDAIEYTNTHLVKACEWQNHPDIWHEEVKLGGEFSIFYPDWSSEISIPNNASQAQIYEAFEGHVMKLAA
jgi:DNA polymerase-1